MLIYEDKLPENIRVDFVDTVKYYSSQLGINPNWLMAIMYFESARTFRPNIQNTTTNATGLIQFMPSTAAELGTSVDALKQMSAVEQLEYVYYYYDRYRSKLNSYVDLYLVTFFPRAVGKPEDYVLQTSNLSASLIANSNPIFDLNNDSHIQVKEIRKVMTDKIPAEWKHEFENTGTSGSTGAIVVTTVVLITAIAILA
jgi:hypothetical protein